MADDSCPKGNLKRTHRQGLQWMVLITLAGINPWFNPVKWRISDNVTLDKSYASSSTNLPKAGQVISRICRPTNE
jgi:hypothetical protein